MPVHKAKKQFGQNFLTDEITIQRIISAIATRQDDVVVEIGPGLGALSLYLIGQAKQLNVIEIDRDLIPKLQQRFSRFPTEKWRIFHQDALTFELASLGCEQKIKLLGNLPYYISTPILFHFLTQLEHIQDMHFMLQKEVVERICASPNSKDYGRLSIMLQYYCACENLFEVPPESFSPVPKVDSAIIRLTPYQKLPYPCDNPALLEKLVAQAFSQRRKTLRNNFKKLDIGGALEQAGIESHLRAENIELALYVRLCNILNHQQKHQDSV